VFVFASSPVPATSNVRWLLLALAGLTAALAVAAPTMALPVLFAEIAEDLSLTLVQVGAVWGLMSFAGLFAGLAGGMLADRFGTKRALSVACLALGVLGAIRGLSANLITMSITVFVASLASTTIPGNLHKLCAYWFSGRAQSMANAVVSAGMALGFMIGAFVSASFLSPWLGSWRGVLFFYGGISVLISIPWFLLPLSKDEHARLYGGHAVSSFRGALSHVIRIRDVWVLGIALLFLGGGIQGTLGYLPLYLRGVGWAAERADSALSGFHAISLLAVFPLVWLSSKLGSKKQFLIAATLVLAAGIGLLSILDGIAIWIGVLLAGFVRDGYMAVFMTSSSQVRGVGAAFTGTALGLIMTLSRIGALLAPPIGNSLAVYGPRMPFVLWGAMALMGLVVILLKPEISGVGLDQTSARL
jgi:MFS transporter, NNP family, nitrate/nitrite transporter